MNRLWQQLAIATNWPVLAAVAVLSILGATSIWQESIVNNSNDGSKQLLFLAVSLGVLILLQTVNYLILGRYAWALYVISLLLIGYTLLGRVITIPGVHAIKGASCWIVFPGGISLEPS